jgi:hypothetical protein
MTRCDRQSIQAFREEPSLESLELNLAMARAMERYFIGGRLHCFRKV